MKIAQRIVCLLLACSAQASFAQPTFDAVFTPDTIGPGSQGELIFSIQNGTGGTVTGQNFTAALPVGVTVGSGRAGSDCTGNLSAAEGGNTISFSAGRMGIDNHCTIRLPITSNLAGTHTLPAVTLNGSAGSVQSAPTMLTVDTQRPGAHLSLTPGNPAFGAQATLTLTLDNSANTDSVTALSFRLPLPRGVLLAPDTNFASSCQAAPVTPTVTFDKDSLTYNYFSIPAFPAVAAGASCTISFDIIANTSPQVFIATDAISATTNNSVNIGQAATTVDIVTSGLNLSSGQTPAQSMPGEPVMLTYTLTNTNRQFGASDIDFTTDLDAALAGLVAQGLPQNNICGAGSSLSGTSVITASGLNLAPGDSCTFSVGLLTPATATAGNYPVTHDDPAGMVDGAPVTGSASALPLNIDGALLVSKSFTTSAAEAGGSATLEFTLTNSDPVNSATNIYLLEQFPVIMPTASSVPSDCNGSGTFIFDPMYNPSGSSAFTPAQLTLTNGSLAAGDSCTFTITLDISPDANSSIGVESGTDTATFTQNGSGELKAHVSSDTIDIVGAIHAVLSADTLTPQPGSLVDFSIALGTGPGSELMDQDIYPSYSNLGFSLDLASAIPGLSAIATPITGCNSSLTGSTTVELSGGSLASGENCELTFTALVPADTAFDQYQLAGPIVSSTSSGLTVEKAMNSLDLEVGGLQISAGFSGQPAEPEDTVTLTFTLNNLSNTDDISALTLHLDTDELINGMAPLAAAVPTPPCGAGSSTNVIGTQLSLVNGAIPAGSGCTYTVEYEVPAGTPSGDYQHILENMTYLLGGTPSQKLNQPVTLSVLAAGDLSDTTDAVPATATGVDPATEILLGDVNGDAIDDALQDNVASIISPITGLPVSLVFDPGCSLVSFTMVDAGTLGADGALNYPDGLARFELQGCASSAMELHLPGGSLRADTLIRKFGVATPGLLSAPGWFDFAGSIDTGNEVMTWNLTDNAPGDQSISANVIIDPIGPALDPDPDGDGIDSAIEQPLGDVNNDGTSDYLQAGVASIVSAVTGQPVALVYDDSNCTLVRFEIVDAATLPANAEHNYPDGLASFELTCETSPIEIHWPGSDLGYGYAVHKYGPQAPDYGAGDLWYDFSAATLDKAARVIRFTLTDNTLGDSTGDDGRLVDPVGVASRAGNGTGLAVNHPLALLLTMLSLLGLGGWLRHRHRAG